MLYNVLVSSDAPIALPHRQTSAAMAFTHVVALKFKEGTDAGVKDRISTQLAQLPGKIPQIRFG